jgi:hypothetical protein
MARDWSKYDPRDIHEVYVNYKTYIEELITEAYLLGRREAQTEEINPKFVRKQKLREAKRDKKDATVRYWLYIRKYNKTGNTVYAARAIRLEKKSSFTLRDAEDQFFGDE